MEQTLPTERTVHVRATSRDIPPLPTGDSKGYRIDFVDGEPRLTYTVDALDDEILGALVHDLATAKTVSWEP